MKFLEAVSVEDVNAIIQSHDAFSDASNWRPYGGAPKNWDRVNVQTSDPVDALAELIINSIDAILMRKAAESGISANDDDCPKDMREAVSRFFPHVPDGRLSNIDSEQRTELAEKSVLIGVRRVKKQYIYPTYTVIDHGEGQHPEDFPKTLLSLGEKNKEGIPYVQGRFNMGSTGSIIFCTQASIYKGHYKFVLSRRNIGSDSNRLWGWTLIRVRKAAKGEKLPVAEYFSPGDSDPYIPSFEEDKIQPLGRSDIGLITGGTVVKMYEYDIGPRARTVDIGLRHALATSLLECALPIRIYDFDAKPEKAKGSLRAEGIAGSTFSGMNITLRGAKSEARDDTSAAEQNGYEEQSDGLEFSDMIAYNSEDTDLGRIRIHGFGIWKMPDYLKNHRKKHRVFYTINGQSQARERASFYREAKLDELRNHLIVQVDCDQMDPTARSTIFKPDRERKNDTETARRLEKIIIDSLKESGKLRQFAAQIHERRVSEQIKEDEQSRDFFEAIVKDSPDLKELLGFGNQISSPASIPGVEKYEGKYFPTYLKPKNRKLLKEGIKEVPINAYRKIVCKTDAVDNYLSREKDRGTFLCPEPNILENKTSDLRSGTIAITVMPPRGATVGQEIEAQFGFTDSNCVHEPLVFTIKIKIVQEEEPQTQPSGHTTPGRGQQPTLKYPECIWVKKEKWDEHEDFDEMTGASISSGETGYTIYVNEDNKYLLNTLSHEPDESERARIKHCFKWGVGILTFSIYRKMHPDDQSNAEGQSDEKDDYDSDVAYRTASSAIAAHVVTIIRKLGRHAK